MGEKCELGKVPEHVNERQGVKILNSNANNVNACCSIESSDTPPCMQRNFVGDKSRITQKNFWKYRKQSS